MNNELKKLIKQEINYLENIKIRINPLKSIQIDDLLICNREKLFKNLPSKGYFVYIIKSNIKINYDEINKKRNEYAQNGYKMSRVNEKENQQTNRDNCLYVGSSKDIKKRLKEHLFLERKSTYALRLNKILNKNILIDIYKFDNEPDEIQVFEDLLWKHYCPLFGRQGKK